MISVPPAKMRQSKGFQLEAVQIAALWGAYGRGFARRAQMLLSPSLKQVQANHSLTGLL